MLKGIVEKVSNDMAKKKDIWFLETMEKHKLIKSSNITNFELYWLKEEMGVRIVNNNENKTQIYMYDALIGEWDNNYEFEEADGLYKVKTNCWN